MATFKRIACVIFTITLCLCYFQTAIHGVIYKQPNEELINALQSAELVKDDLGLADVNFENLKALNPITVYDYTKDGFV